MTRVCNWSIIFKIANIYYQFCYLCVIKQLGSLFSLIKVNIIYWYFFYLQFYLKIDSPCQIQVYYIDISMQMNHRQLKGSFVKIKRGVNLGASFMTRQCNMSKRYGRNLWSERVLHVKAPNMRKILNCSKIIKLSIETEEKHLFLTRWKK